MSDIRISKEHGLVIPPKHYVGFQYRLEYNSEDITESVLLGFATPILGKKSEDEKRQATVNKWASYKKNDESDENKKLAPIILENTFKEGYRIVDTFSRGGYFGGARNVWRVKTPDGYELEIDSGNLALIMNYCTIENGLIKDECIWGRKGSTNYLLPKSSKMVEISLDRPDNSNKSVALKDVLPGSTVVLHDGMKVVYYGKYYFVTSNKTPNSNITEDVSNAQYRRRDVSPVEPNTFHVRERCIYRYFVKEDEDCVYQSSSSLKIGYVVSTPSQEDSQKIYQSTLGSLIDKCMYHEAAGVTIYEQSYSSYAAAPVIYIFEKKKEAELFAKQPFSTLQIVIPQKYNTITSVHKKTPYRNDSLIPQISYMSDIDLDAFIKNTNIMMSKKILKEVMGSSLCFRRNIDGRLFHFRHTDISVACRKNSKISNLSEITSAMALRYGRAISPESQSFNNNEVGVYLNGMESLGSMQGHEYYKYSYRRERAPSLHPSIFTMSKVVADTDINQYLKDSQAEREVLFDQEVSLQKIVTLDVLEKDYSICLMAYCVQLNGQTTYIVKVS